MITILLLLLVILVVAILALIIAGIGYLFWPVLLILGIGLVIDILTIKTLFKRR